VQCCWVQHVPQGHILNLASLIVYGPASAALGTRKVPAVPTPFEAEWAPEPFWMR